MINEYNPYFEGNGDEEEMRNTAAEWRAIAKKFMSENFSDESGQDAQDSVVAFELAMKIASKWTEMADNERDTRTEWERIRAYTTSQVAQ